MFTARIVPTIFVSFIGLAACETADTEEALDDDSSPTAGKYDVGDNSELPCVVLEASGLLESWVPPVRGDRFSMKLDDLDNVSFEFSHGYISIPVGYDRVGHHEGFRLNSRSGGAREPVVTIDVSTSNAEGEEPTAQLVWIRSDLYTPAHNHYDHLLGSCPLR